MRRCSRRSCCTICVGIRAFMSAGRSFTRGHLTPSDRLSHRLDDAGELVEHLADLTFTHDQWRTERQGIADGTEHDIVFEETQVEGLDTALADGIGLTGEVNAYG